MYHMQFPRRPLCHVFSDVFSPERGDTAGECGVNLLTQPLVIRACVLLSWKGKKRVRFVQADSISSYEQNLQSKQNQKDAKRSRQTSPFLMDIITVVSK